MDKTEYQDRLRTVLEKCLVEKDETIEALEKEVDELIDDNKRLKEDRDALERMVRNLSSRLEKAQYDTYPA